MANLFAFLICAAVAVLALVGLGAKTILACLPNGEHCAAWGMAVAILLLCVCGVALWALGEPMSDGPVE